MCSSVYNNRSSNAVIYEASVATTCELSCKLDSFRSTCVESSVHLCKVWFSLLSHSHCLRWTYCVWVSLCAIRRISACHCACISYSLTWNEFALNSWVCCSFSKADKNVLSSRLLNLFFKQIFWLLIMSLAMVSPANPIAAIDCFFISVVVVVAPLLLYMFVFYNNDKIDSILCNRSSFECTTQDNDYTYCCN